MKTNQRCLRVSGLAALMLTAGTVQVAHAQIGTGWIQTTLTKYSDIDGCGSISSTQFRLSCSTASGYQRAEYKLGSSTTGYRQFEGYVKVTSLSGHKISLKQTFHHNVGAFFMLAIRHDGGLYDHGNSGAGTFMYGVVGQTVRVNTIFGGGQHKLYLNGSLKNTRSMSSGAYFDKYGVYRTASGYGPVTAYWTSVRSFRR